MFRSLNVNIFEFVRNIMRVVRKIRITGDRRGRVTSGVRSGVRSCEISDGYILPLPSLVAKQITIYLVVLSWNVLCVYVFSSE